MENYRHSTNLFTRSQTGCDYRLWELDFAYKQV